MKNKPIKANQSNIETIATLGTQTFIETYAQHNTEEDMQNYINEYFNHERIAKELKNSKMEYFLIYEDDEAVAYVKLNFAGVQTDLNEADSIEIERIYVLSSQKGKGLGKQLIQMSITRAKESQSKFIWLGVWTKNTAAITFYEKMGFKQFSTHTFKLGDDLQKDSLMKYEVT